MGRVDEAMRRLAETGAAPSSEFRQDDGDGRSRPFREPDSEAFPNEVPERRRLRKIDGLGDSPVRPGVGELPPLEARIGEGLSRKVVVDPDIDRGSREQYRRLATALYAAQADGGLKVVMVASALPSEGKSLTAANLAMTFSESYQKNVLLIDGDLHRPSLHTVFGLDQAPGLTDGIRGPDGALPTMHPLTPTLSVITAGQPAADPMAVFASPRMHRLIDDARRAFDWVVVDTPPIGLLSDARMLAELADGAVLVIRASATPYDVVQRAVAALGADRLLGVVLNQASGQHAGRYDSYYYTPAPPTRRGNSPAS